MNSNEKKKMYLERYRELVFETDQLFDEAEYWQEKVYIISATKLGNFGIRGGYTRNNPLDTLWDIYEKCRRKARFAYRQQMEIREAIDRLAKPIHRTVLKLRYIEGYRIKDIAKKLDYSEVRMYHIFENAIDSFQIPA